MRTIIVYTRAGKDSAEHPTNSIMSILEEADHLKRCGLRYNAEKDRYLGQMDRDGIRSEMKEGDRDVMV
jgi:hypothetical protein